MQNKTDQTEEKNEAGENKEEKSNIKQNNLFMRFLNWIAKGAEKAAKKGGGCCS
ncbi:MAG: hypothetical protein HQK65_02875 [Desulfamplus sp.]|nr:hypothetical protein [Desulfamplus sp.]